jgi:hypothetical protein
VEANRTISDLKNSVRGHNIVAFGGKKHMFLELGSSERVLEEILEDRQSYLPLRLDCPRDLKTGDWRLLSPDHGLRSIRITFSSNEA